MLTHSAIHTEVTPEITWKVLEKTMLVDGLDLVLDLKKSRGARLYDSLRQRTLIDFFSFFASAPVGANHPKMWEDDAYLDKLLHAAVVNPTNSDIYSVEMAEFVGTFQRLAMPKWMRYTFWISGGTLGVENALKAAFDWKVRKNFKKGYKEERGHQVIHFHEAFHGRSGYTLSLTNTDPVKTAYFPKFNWPRISNPKMAFPLNEERLAEVERAEQKAILEIKEAFRRNKDDIAAIIIEPIQGEGGDNHFRKEFLKALRVLSLENDAMLIADEVQTGVGLTGTMWASQQLFGDQENEEAMPDMIAFGKKMQVCGFMCSRRLDEVPDNVFHVSGRLNSTWGGSLTDMVRSKRYLEIIHEEMLTEHAARVGIVLLEKIRAIEEDFKGLVTNARGRGLMCAFDLPDKETRNKFIQAAQKNGVIILGSGQHSVRFRPPLTITADEIDEGILLLRKALGNLS